MKKFIQWWLKGTGFGGKIKFYTSIVFLILVVIAQSTQSSQPSTSNKMNYGNQVYEDCVDELYGDTWEEVCY